MNLVRSGSRTSVPDDYPFSRRIVRLAEAHDFLPQFSWQSDRDFYPPSRHNGQLVRRACIGVYRPIGTAAGVLLPFVIYAALSSAPQQRSYGFDRSNPSVACSIRSSFLPRLLPALLYRDSVSFFQTSNRASSFYA